MVAPPTAEWWQGIHEVINAWLQLNQTGLNYVGKTHLSCSDNRNPHKKCWTMSTSFNGNLSQSYATSPAIWNHTVLNDTRHRWMCHHLNPSLQGWYLIEKGKNLSWHWCWSIHWVRRELNSHLMASCVGNTFTKNSQNLTTGFQVTVENVGDACLRHSAHTYFLGVGEKLVERREEGVGVVHGKVWRLHEGRMKVIRCWGRSHHHLLQTEVRWPQCGCFHASACANMTGINLEHNTPSFLVLA